MNEEPQKAEIHPEEMGEPIISPAVQDILVDNLMDVLRFGTPERPNGTHTVFEAPAERHLGFAKSASTTGELTWTHLLLAQAFEVASKTDPAQLRHVLTSLGGTVVQWIESLDRESM